MNKHDIAVIRHIVQHHADVEDADNWDALFDFLNLDNREREVLEKFLLAVCDHVLERLIERR